MFGKRMSRLAVQLAFQAILLLPVTAGMVGDWRIAGRRLCCFSSELEELAFLC